MSLAHESGSGAWLRSLALNSALNSSYILPLNGLSTVFSPFLGVYYPQLRLPLSFRVAHSSFYFSV